MCGTDRSRSEGPKESARSHRNVDVVRVEEGAHRKPGVLFPSWSSRFSSAMASSAVKGSLPFRFGAPSRGRLLPDPLGKAVGVEEVASDTRRRFPRSRCRPCQSFGDSPRRRARGGARARRATCLCRRVCSRRPGTSRRWSDRVGREPGHVGAVGAFGKAIGVRVTPWSDGYWPVIWMRGWGRRPPTWRNDVRTETPESRRLVGSSFRDGSGRSSSDSYTVG